MKDEREMQEQRGRKGKKKGDQGNSFRPRVVRHIFEAQRTSKTSAFVRMVATTPSTAQEVERRRVEALCLALAG